MIKVVKEFYKNRTEYFFYILFLLIAAILCIFALDVFLDITRYLKAGDMDAFDESVTAFIYSYRAEALTKYVVIPITEMGGQWAYLIVIPIIGFLLYKRGHSWRLSLQGTIILASTFLLNLGIKHIISRPRPILANRLVEVGDGSFSYPSGHSMSAFAFYGFIIFLTYKLVKRPWLKWTLILIQVLLILAIGTSRVYLGVHYPSDVLAGFVAGLIWLALCIMAVKTINFYSNKKSKEPTEDLEDVVA